MQINQQRAMEKNGLISKPCDETFLIPFPIVQMKYLEITENLSKWKHGCPASLTGICHLPG